MFKIVIIVKTLTQVNVLDAKIISLFLPMDQYALLLQAALLVNTLMDLLVPVIQELTNQIMFV